MKRFAELIRKLDSTNKTNVKVKALSDYFGSAPDDDKVWAIALLSHRRPSRPVNATLIREFAMQASDIPAWLFEESYHIVGDLAETIALTVQGTTDPQNAGLSHHIHELIDLRKKTEEEKREYLVNRWKHMDYYQRFVFTKLLTGGFRIGISQKLMTRALSMATGIEEDTLAYRLMGNWDPSSISFKELVLEENSGEGDSRPYPFYLSYAIDKDVSELGDPKDWACEYKWDGIRSQVIVRSGQVHVWSRGEELVTDKFPELHALKERVPDGTVIDGEILVYKEGNIGSFNELQTRIGRKNVTKSILKKSPVILKAYDLLEFDRKDIRKESYLKRRERLATIVDNAGITQLQISPYYILNDWESVNQMRDKSRENISEGLMIKRLDSIYEVGRKKGDWWKWKVDPLTIDGVLTFAMRGHGRRSNLFTDYTFGVWKTNEDGKKELVTFAKAYSGLTDEEFRQVDDFIKKNTLERFGPVRSVVPELVFEIAFEGIAKSSRHKSGVSLRFPRMFRWRKDKKPEEANTLEDLLNLIQ